MKAIAVIPGKPDSIHLREAPKPSLDEVPGGRGVLVRVLRVGVDGTDKEINAAEYGAPPAGHDYLILGHESFGRVEAVGPERPTDLAPGDYVVATVRRPGTSIYDAIGLQDMTTDDSYFERGINLLHGYLTEYYVDAADYIVKIPQRLEVGRRAAGADDRRREGDRPGLRDPAAAQGLAAAEGRGPRDRHARPPRRR